MISMNAIRVIVEFNYKKMKVKVYYKRNFKEPYSLAVVHVPNHTENVKEWLKTHLKGLNFKANYLIYEKM